jgi:hypothetical protein
VLLHTYRLHEYFGLTPNFAHASLSGVPSGISIFLLPDVSTVICNEVEVKELLSFFRLIELLLDELGTATNACVVRPSSTSSSVDIDIIKGVNLYISWMMPSNSSAVLSCLRSDYWRRLPETTLNADVADAESPLSRVMQGATYIFIAHRIGVIIQR